MSPRLVVGYGSLVLAIFLMSTAAWYPIWRKVAPRIGLYRRNGKIREMSPVEWVNAVGMSIIPAAICLGIATNALKQSD
ncbi:MAG: hypothetical protein QM775_03560 [Pirellulales bacterium]